MAEKQNDTSANTDDRHKGGGHTGPKKCGVREWVLGSVPFVVGLVGALAFGWLVFPDLMFVKKEQPIAFNHQVHLVKAGMACTDCHTPREDGSFRGMPSTAGCAACHAEIQGNSPQEKKFVEEYVKPGREVPWLVYQKQPSNVYFSHAAHSIETCNTCHDFAPMELCNLCHIDVARTTTPPPMYENWITGYSRTTMTMDACERCHAYPDHLNTTNANNACFVCHK